MLHGKIKTFDYLYRLNLGPLDNCVLCGLAPETEDHIFRQCPKCLLVRNLLDEQTGLNLSIPDHITNGSWIIPQVGNHHPSHTASLIAASSWFLWKTRRGLIFNNKQPDFSRIIHNISNHIKEFTDELFSYELTEAGIFGHLCFSCLE